MQFAASVIPPDEFAKLVYEFMSQRVDKEEGTDSDTVPPGLTADTDGEDFDEKQPFVKQEELDF